MSQVMPSSCHLPGSCPCYPFYPRCSESPESFTARRFARAGCSPGIWPNVKREHLEKCWNKLEQLQLKGWTMLDMSFYFLAFSGGSVQKLGKHTHTVDDASSCQFLGIDTGNVPREIPRLHAHHTASPFAGKLPGRLFEFQKPKEHEASESKKNMSSIYHGSILPRTNSEKQRARSKKIFNHTPNITQYLTSYSGPACC